MQRQKKLFAGEPLFAHVDLLKEKRLHVLSSICTPDLLNIWQEPCIVFAPHWSLRLGPAVHFLQRWRGDENSLLVLEKGLDADLALLPFKPLAMKVLQCSFLSGIRMGKVAPLLEKLQPKCVLFPEDLRTAIDIPKAKPFSVVYYSENHTLRAPNLKRCAKLEISTDVASRFRWINLKEEDINITRLKGELAWSTEDIGYFWALTPRSPPLIWVDFQLFYRRWALILPQSRPQVVAWVARLCCMFMSLVRLWWKSNKQGR